MVKEGLIYLKKRHRWKKYIFHLDQKYLFRVKSNSHPVCARACECGGVWRSVEECVEECGGVWRSVEECGGVWRSVEECGGVWRSVEECRGVEECGCV